MTGDRRTYPARDPFLRMRIVLALCLIAALAVFTPSVAADVAVRTCDSPTFCRDVVSVPVPVDCNVDLMKNGLGKPPDVRLDCLA